MKTISGNVKKKKAYLSPLMLVVAVSAFFMFWRIDEVPPVEADEAIVYYANYLLFKSFLAGIPFTEITADILYKQTIGFYKKLIFYPFAFPLYTLWEGVIIAIAGLSKTAISLSSAMLGFATVLVSYVLASFLYGKRVGAISAILLASSLLFTIHARNSGLQMAGVLSVLATVYFLSRAELSHKTHYYWLSGLSLGLGLFTGYAPVLLSTVILLCWLVWTHRGFTFLKNVHIWGGVVLAAATFMGLMAGFSKVFLGNYTGAFARVAEFTHARAGHVSMLNYDPGFLLSNIHTAFFSLFVAMPPLYTTLSDPNRVLVGVPMISPLVAPFLLWGIVLAVKRRTDKDKLVLSWLGVIGLVSVLVVTFEGRYILIASTAIYTLAAIGIAHAAEVVGKIIARRVPKIKLFRENERGADCRVKAIAVFLCSVLLLTVSVLSYRDYFVAYAGVDANLWRDVGQRELAEYISRRTPPDKCSVVFGRKELVPYEQFVVFTRGAYGVQRWDAIIRAHQANPIRLQEWENGIFAKGVDVIYYVFSLDNEFSKAPGKPPHAYKGPYEDLSLFLKLHPDIKPAKVIRYTAGQEAYAIYEVGRPSRPSFDYDASLGGEIQMRVSQALKLRHPNIEKLRFRISYAGDRNRLQDLVVELRNTDPASKEPDLSPRGLLKSIKVLPSDLRLDRGEYSAIDFPYSGLSEGGTYAIVWRQAQPDVRNHYVLARRTLDVYEGVGSGRHDGKRWTMSPKDIDVIPQPVDYVVRTTPSAGIRTIHIPGGQEKNGGRETVTLELHAKEWKKEVYDQANIDYASDGRNWSWLNPATDAGGYLLYKIDSPYPISRMELITNPRIHNDKGGANKVVFSYSVDGRAYREIYAFISNGSESWSGVYEWETYDIIHPASNTVFLRFDLGAKNSQLWADASHPMVFSADLVR